MKNKFSDIIIKLFNFHSHAVILKKSYLDYKFFLNKLKEITKKKVLSLPNSYSSQKNILNYIASRNMRKTLTPSNISEVKASFRQINKTSTMNIKDFLQVILVNWQQSKSLLPLQSSTNILKFYTNPGLLGNLNSKQSERGLRSELEDPNSWGGPESFKLIILLGEDFDEVLQKHPSLIVLFYAYWCPHCLRLKKPFGITALKAKEANLPIQFAAFDVTINPDIADEKGVTGIPTIKYYKDGKLVETYRGKRTPEDLFEFVKNPPLPLAVTEQEENV